jgi:hypothetical protein
MAAGVTTRVGSIADLVGLLPAVEHDRRPAQEDNLVGAARWAIFEP